MKVKKTKRLLALILCMALVLGTNTFTMAADASQSQGEIVQEQENGSQEEAEIEAEEVQDQVPKEEETIEEEPQTYSLEETEETMPEENVTDELTTEEVGEKEMQEQVETDPAETSKEETATAEETNSKSQEGPSGFSETIEEHTGGETTAEEVMDVTEEAQDDGETAQEDEQINTDQVEKTEDFAESTEESFDYNSLSAEELYDFLSSLNNDGQYIEITDSLTEEKKTELYDYIDSISSGEEILVENGATNYLDAEKAQLLLENVSGISGLAAVNALSLSEEEEDQGGFDTAGKSDHAGLEISKKINEYSAETGVGELQLESYVTGRVSTNLRLPVDIVLVLDQSGSMADKFGYKYTTNVSTNNEDAYKKQNTTSSGGREYYFYKIDDTYYRVSIDRETSEETYQPYSGYYMQMSSLYESRNDLYIKDGNNYYRVKFKRQRQGILSSWKYSASYEKDGETIPITTEQSGNTNWNSSEWGTLYTLSVTYTYTYYWIDVNGERRLIGTSEGTNGRLENGTLYYRQEDTQNGTPKINALKTAVNSFITSVQTDAEENQLDHKIAIVGFGSESGYGDNTEILSIEGKNSNVSGTRRTVGEDYDDLKTEDYANALRDSDADILTDAVNALDTNGATRTDLGMEIASKILQNRQTTTVNIDGNTYERPTVVIMFTDGTPTTGTTFDRGVANKTVEYAREMKAGLTIGRGWDQSKLQPTNVYTVGIFSGADAGADPTANSTSNENKFMQAVSSNYPNATAYNSLGAKNPDVTDGKSFYLSADDEAALKQAFQSIAENIGGGANAELDETSVMYDKMSQYFKLPEGTDIDDIEVEVQETADGGLSWTTVDGGANGLGVFIEGDVVKVTGFDYSEWYVAEDHTGRKVVVKIPIQYKNDEYFGGNNIPTNSGTSGMYTADGSDCYGNFDIPAVNNPINYRIDSVDQTIYITNQGDLDKLLAYADGYKPNGVNNAFVNITYTLKDSKDNDLGTLIIPAGSSAENVQWVWTTAGKEGKSEALTECTNYELVCSVAPSVTDPVKDSNGNVIGEAAIQTEYNGEKAERPVIHVVRPVISGQDQFIFLGEKAEFEEDITWTVEEGWTDMNIGHTKIPSVTGNKPTLTITPVYAAGTTLTDADNYYPEEDSDFTIKVKIGDRDITQYCDITSDTDTQHNTECIENDSNAEHDFTIHVVAGKIEINKIISGNWNAAIEGDPIFTFKITYNPVEGVNREEKVYYRTIRFSGNETQKTAELLEGLPKGNYTVTELTTQKYEFDSSSTDGSTCRVEGAGTKSLTFHIGQKTQNIEKINATTGKVSYTNKKTGPSTNTDTDTVVNRFEYNEQTKEWTVSKIPVPGAGQEDTSVVGD